MTWENPERGWERPDVAKAIDPGEIERRIGPISGTVEVLSGGLVNLNVRIGDRVLRVYRRDPTAARVEAALLRRQWRSFRVPRVLEQGADFLLLEFIPHKPMGGTAEQGAAVGRALAEVHALRFDRAGLLDADLHIAREFPSFPALLREYASRGLRAGPLAHLHDPVLEALQGLQECPSVLLHGDWKSSNLLWSGDALLVLDWEFAYAGASLMDVGQLLRWPPPEAFVRAFEECYLPLPGDWRRQAELFDLANLAGLAERGKPGSRRARDVEQRILQTLRPSSGRLH